MKINRAFSLLEILIAMALGSFISLGLADLYFSYERNYQFQKAMMQATQNGILASNMIETLLSQVGYAGCLSLKNVKITSHIALPGFPFVLRDATTSLLRTNGALRRTTQAITALKILNNTDTKITL